MYVCYSNTDALPRVVYRQLKGDQAIIQIIVYVLANLAGIGLGLYKFHNMGLLPTAQSDWLEFMEERRVRLINVATTCVWQVDIATVYEFALSWSDAESRIYLGKMVIVRQIGLVSYLLQIIIQAAAEIVKRINNN